MLELFFFRIALCKHNNASNFFNERIFKGLKIHMDAIIHILVVCMCHMCSSSLSAWFWVAEKYHDGLHLPRNSYSAAPAFRILLVVKSHALSMAFNLSEEIVCSYLFFVTFLLIIYTQLLLPLFPCLWKIFNIKSQHFLWFELLHALCLLCCLVP